MQARSDADQLIGQQLVRGTDALGKGDVQHRRSSAAWINSLNQVLLTRIGKTRHFLDPPSDSSPRSASAEKIDRSEPTFWQQKAGNLQKLVEFGPESLASGMGEAGDRQWRGNRDFSTSRIG
jgi:hypothetical protein